MSFSIILQPYSVRYNKSKPLQRSSSPTVPWYITLACFEIASHDNDMAQQTFDTFVKVLDNINDEGYKLEAKLARVFRRFALQKVDSQLIDLIRELVETDTELKSILLRRDIIEYAKNIGKEHPESNANNIVWRMYQLEVELPGFFQAIIYVVRNEYSANSELPLVPPAINPMKDFHRLMARQQFNTIEEAQQWTQSMVGKRIPEIPLMELTPDEIAQDLCEEALQLPQKQQRSALMGIAADYPDSMWPWIDLCSLSNNGIEQLKFSEEGLKRRAKFETEEFLNENKGHFWG